MSDARCLGIDPGSAHPAWGVVGGAQGREVIGQGMLEVSCPAESLTALLRTYEPDAVAIEIVEAVRIVRWKRGEVQCAGVGAEVALSLYSTGLVTGELRYVARVSGRELFTFSAETCRRALFGIPNPDQERIETTLRSMLTGFPAPRKSNTHQRDALAAARFGLLRWLAEQRQAS